MSHRLECQCFCLFLGLEAKGVSDLNLSPLVILTKCTIYVSLYQSRGFEEDRDYLIEYQPEHLDHVNVLLCGGVGAGKSTLINSLLTIFHNTVVGVAKRASSTESVTTDVSMYPLEGRRRMGKDAMKTSLRLWDTPGFTYGEDAATYQHKQMRFMVEGCIPDGFEGLDKKSISLVPPGTTGINMNPRAGDKMQWCFSSSTTST